MRRFARHLFTLGAAASLALLAFGVCLWVAGHSRMQPYEYWHRPPFPEPLTAREAQARLDTYGTTGKEITWRFVSHRGRVVVERHHGGDPALNGRPGAVWERGRWGFAEGGSYWWTPKRNPRGMIYGSVRWWRVRWWPIMLACAVLPALWLWSFRRRARERRLQGSGHCVACGYDLRASEGRCPECGTEPVATGGAA